VVFAYLKNKIEFINFQPACRQAGFQFPIPNCQFTIKNQFPNFQLKIKKFIENWSVENSKINSAVVLPILQNKKKRALRKTFGIF